MIVHTCVLAHNFDIDSFAGLALARLGGTALEVDGEVGDSRVQYFGIGADEDDKEEEEEACVGGIWDDIHRSRLKEAAKVGLETM